MTSINMSSNLTGYILQTPTLIKTGMLSAHGFYGITRHCHPTTELILITKGYAHIEMEGRHLYAKERSLVVYPAWHTHFDEFYNGDSDVENYYVRIAGLQIRDLPKGYLLPPDMPPVLDVGSEYDELLCCFNTIYMECMLRLPDYSTVVNRAIMCLLLLVQRLCSQKQNAQPSPAQLLCQRVLAYIGENYSNSIDAQSIASAMNVSYSHLNRVFKQEMHTSPSQYITFMRILKAQQYLLFTSMDPHAIAHLVGYSRFSVFNKHFISQTRTTPSEYRSKYDLTNSEAMGDHLLLE